MGSEAGEGTEVVSDSSEGVEHGPEKKLRMRKSPQRQPQNLKIRKPMINRIRIRWRERNNDMHCGESAGSSDGRKQCFGHRLTGHEGRGCGEEQKGATRRVGAHSRASYDCTPSLLSHPHHHRTLYTNLDEGQVDDPIVLGFSENHPTGIERSLR